MKCRSLSKYLSFNSKTELWKISVLLISASRCRTDSWIWTPLPAVGAGILMVGKASWPSQIAYWQCTEPHAANQLAARLEQPQMWQDRQKTDDDDKGGILGRKRTEVQGSRGSAAMAPTKSSLLPRGKFWDCSLPTGLILVHHMTDPIYDDFLYYFPWYLTLRLQS